MTSKGLPYDSIQLSTHGEPPPTYFEDDRNSGTTVKWMVRAKTLALGSVVVLGCAVVLGFAGYGIYYAVAGGDTDVTTTTPSVTTSPGSTASTSTTTETTSPTTTIPTTTEKPPDEGGWGEWTSWSDCDVTCGNGVRVRERQCYPGEVKCKGRSEESEPCNDGDCPVPDYGEWTSWGAWSDCSTSCGDSGTQERERTCEKDPGDEDCRGDSGQIRGCNRYGCPSCDNRTCPDDGTGLPPDCKICECDGQTYSVHVTDKNNVPIVNAEISDAFSPLDVIALTDNNGDVTIDKACNGVKLVYSHPNYIDDTVAIDTSGPAKVKLDVVEQLTFIDHPQPKARLVGEDVLLCCSAVGFPEAEYYEWFKDSLYIGKGTPTTNGSSLILTSLKKNDTGNYQCRANNDKSSVFSENAFLEVKDLPDDFCVSAPQAKVTLLPRNCTVGNSRYLDVGKCSGKVCRSARDASNTCVDDNNHCCGPVDYSMVRADCPESAGLTPMFVIKTCGCKECSKPSARILGRVVRSDDISVPISYATIFINNENVTVTNEKGFFDFSVRPEKPKITFEVKDAENNFMSAIKTVRVRRNNVFRKFVFVKMLPLPPAVKFPSDEEYLFDLGSIAQLYFPPNNFLYLDGSAFTGTVNARIIWLDPSRYEDLENMPGDLLTVDGNGGEGLLRSFGMFGPKFFADDGQQLQLKSSIKVFLNAVIANVGNGSQVELWTMDPNSGFWGNRGNFSEEDEEITTLRRSFRNGDLFDDVKVGDITIPVENEWTNFDGNENRVCYTKVRAWLDDTFNPNLEYKGSQFDSFTIAVYAIDGSSTSAQMSTHQAWDNDYDNGVCIIHFCDLLEATKEDWYGYITVESHTTGTPERMYAADQHNAFHQGQVGLDNKTIDYLQYKALSNENRATGAAELLFKKYNMPSNTTGPFYDISTYNGKKWGGSSSCASAGTADQEIRFYYNGVEDMFVCENKFDDKTMPVYPALASSSSNGSSANMLTWPLERSLSSFGACYLKVNVIGYSLGAPLSIRNLVGNISKVYGEDDYIKPSDPYGESGDCSTSKSATASVCLPLKRPGLMFDGFESIEDETWIQVKLGKDTASRSCTVEVLAPNLGFFTQKIIKGVGEDEFEMYLPKDIFTEGGGSLYGMYCRSGINSSLEDAEKAAWNDCATGSSGGQPDFQEPLEISESGPAVVFKCEETLQES